MSGLSSLYVCVAKEDCPDRPAPSCTESDTCSRCHRDVWVDPVSRNLARALGQGACVTVCDRCCTGML